MRVEPIDDAWSATDDLSPTGHGTVVRTPAVSDHLRSLPVSSSPCVAGVGASNTLVNQSEIQR
jgi:hypothetical protein